MENIAFMDFQYLLGNNNQIFIKELAFIRASSVTPQVFYFKPPYQWQDLEAKYKKQNKFCAKYINKIRWDYGDLNYIELSYFIRDLNADETLTTIFVKGEDRVNFLKKYLFKVQELKMPGSFENYTFQKHDCKIHNDNFTRCSINHVLQMSDFYKQENK